MPNTSRSYASRICMYVYLVANHNYLFHILSNIILWHIQVNRYFLYKQNYMMYQWFLLVYFQRHTTLHNIRIDGTFKIQNSYRSFFSFSIIAISRYNATRSFSHFNLLLIVKKHSYWMSPKRLAVDSKPQEKKKIGPSLFALCSRVIFSRLWNIAFSRLNRNYATMGIYFN